MSSASDYIKKRLQQLESVAKCNTFPEHPTRAGLFPAAPPPRPSRLYVSPSLDTYVLPDDPLFAGAQSDILVNDMPYRQLDVYYLAWIREVITRNASKMTPEALVEIKAKLSVIEAREPELAAYACTANPGYSSPVPLSGTREQLSEHITLVLQQRPHKNIPQSGQNPDRIRTESAKLAGVTQNVGTYAQKPTNCVKVYKRDRLPKGIF